MAPTASCAGRPAALRALAALAALGVAVVACGDEPTRPQRLELAHNRAYSGAPPTIPHPVAERGRQECLSCHLRGDATADNGVTLAKRTPHPELEHCVSCHVMGRRQKAFRKTTFRGKTYAMGLRATPGAPLLIPHPLTMRENCLGCHDAPRTHPSLRVTHPERTRCLQCHLPAYMDAPGPRHSDQAATSAEPGAEPTWSL